MLTTFDLDKDYSASFVPYRQGAGYVAKGTIFRSGKPVSIFEARGRTIPHTAEAARAKAEICRSFKTKKQLPKGF